MALGGQHRTASDRGNEGEWGACCAQPWRGLAWVCLACLALAWSSNNNRPSGEAQVPKVKAVRNLGFHMTPA